MLENKYMEQSMKKTFITLQKYINKRTGINATAIDRITEHIYVSNTENIIEKSSNVDTLLFLTDGENNKDLIHLNKIDKTIYNIPFNNNIQVICLKTLDIITDCTNSEKSILIISRTGIEEPFMVLANYFLSRYYLLYKYRTIDQNINILNFGTYYIKFVAITEGYKFAALVVLNN